MMVFLRTDPHRPDLPQHNHGLAIELTRPGDNSRNIVAAAAGLLDHLHLPHHTYVKAGGMLLDLVNRDQQQITLFDSPRNETDRAKSVKFGCRSLFVMRGWESALLYCSNIFTLFRILAYPESSCRGTASLSDVLNQSKNPRGTMQLRVPMILVAAVAAFVVGCASHAVHDEAGIIGNVTFSGARDDQSVISPSTTVSVDIKPTEGRETTTRFPPTYAVYCDQDKTSCQHAVVKTTLEVKYVPQRHGGFLAEGRLISEMGRSLTNRNENTAHSISIPDEVPLIASRNEVTQINTVVLLGRPAVFHGSGGTTIILKAVR